MLHRGMAVGLIQASLLGFGLSGLYAGAADVGTNAPPTLVTNIVARRAARDVIQTLLALTPASNPVAVAAHTALPDSVLSNAPQSDMIWTSAVAHAHLAGATLITNSFAGFVPGSLANTIWTGFHTNGRSTRMWEFSQLPPGWPNQPPVLRWNTNSLLWGRKGMTAICQVIEGMGSFGQGAMTALTRRHGYVRGHSMGPTGLDPTRVGRRVWFCTRDSQLVERKIRSLFIRAPEPGSTNDYSIILFDADLPPGIEPMRVADRTAMFRKYFFGDLSHKPYFTALQEGYVSANVPGWTVPIRAGDSGNPVMLPLPDELVFIGGITTSPPGAQMQADMDLLSRQAGLDPRKYQLQWVNLAAYPDFAPKL
jgi:hypothetical protein